MDSVFSSIARKGDNVMLKYIIKRILVAIPTFIGITLLVFVLSSMAPGGPLTSLRATMTEEAVDELEHQYGLDRPILVQYGDWFKDLFKGDLGTSYKSGKPVMELMSNRIGPTLVLTLTAFVLSTITGVVLGIISAVNDGGKGDKVISAIAFISQSVPGFFLSVLMLWLFSVKLGWLPTSGMYGITGERSISELIKHLVLPAGIMAFGQLGSLIRYTKSGMLEVMNEEYIKTAKSKGIGAFAVNIRHAFRNSLIPIVTILGTEIPNLIGGSVIIEQIFGWPGLGTLMMTSVTSRDYPTIMGITCIISAVVLVVNLLVDLIYGLLDPRISYK